MQMPVRTIGNLLNTKDNGDLGDLLERAQSMSELAATLSAALPDDLGNSILAANIRAGGELVVICRSPAWASRLRYESDALLSAARKYGVAVERCTLKVSRNTAVK